MRLCWNLSHRNVYQFPLTKVMNHSHKKSPCSFALSNRRDFNYYAIDLYTPMYMQYSGSDMYHCMLYNVYSHIIIWNVKPKQGNDQHTFMSWQGLMSACSDIVIIWVYSGLLGLPWFTWMGRKNKDGLQPCASDVHAHTSAACSVMHCGDTFATHHTPIQSCYKQIYSVPACGVAIMIVPG